MSSGLVSVRRYEPDDLERFMPRLDFAQALAAEGGELPPGQKWTLIALGAPEPCRVLGVAGLERQADGRLAAWACLAELTSRQWIGAAYWTRRVLVAQGPGARVTAIPAPTAQAVRLLKRIGFVDVGEPYMVWEG